MRGDDVSATIARLDEWLDNAKDFNALPIVNTRALLRQARTLIMECQTILAPAPSRDHATTQSSPIDFGISIERSPIFEETTDTYSWQSGMLAAMSTARKMGATNFEIEVKEFQGKRRHHPGQPRSFHEAMLAGMSEDWSMSSATVWQVTIFAVRVK